MNNLFSLPRFLMLFRKHMLEKSKEYLLSTLTLTIIITALLSFIAYKDSSGLREDMQGVAFVISIILSGIIFTSKIFSDLGNKKKSTNYLMLPASHLEKYLVNWSLSYIFFQVVFIVVFYLATFIVLSFRINEIGNSNRVFNILDTQNNIYLIFLVYLAVHSFMFFGSIKYRKNHFIKTIFLLFSFASLFSLFNWILSSLIISPKILTSFPLTSLRFIEDGKYYNITHASNTVIAVSLTIIVSALLWLSAFYRLKEKEV